MGKFLRTQVRLATDQIRRLKKLSDRTGVDRSNHIRVAIARYLDEEELREKLKREELRREIANTPPH